MWLCGCDTSRIPSTELCGNGLDDDRDGLIDCADPTCAESAVCLSDAGADPEVPAWLDSEYEVPLFETDCDGEAELDETVYAVGCSLFPDNCGEGLRCVPLTREGVGVETGCVRQGCDVSPSPCTRSARGSLADSCARHQLCLGVETVCDPAAGPCCTELCVLEDPHCSQCLDLRRLYGEALPGIEGVGLCLNDPSEGSG